MASPLYHSAVSLPRCSYAERWDRQFSPMRQILSSDSAYPLTRGRLTILLRSARWARPHARNQRKLAILPLLRSYSARQTNHLHSHARTHALAHRHYRLVLRTTTLLRHRHRPPSCLVRFRDILARPPFAQLALDVPAQLHVAERSGRRDRELGVPLEQPYTKVADVDHGLVCALLDLQYVHLRAAPMTLLVELVTLELVAAAVAFTGSCVELQPCFDGIAAKKAEHVFAGGLGEIRERLRLLGSGKFFKVTRLGASVQRVGPWRFRGGTTCQRHTTDDMRRTHLDSPRPKQDRCCSRWSLGCSRTDGLQLARLGKRRRVRNHLGRILGTYWLALVCVLRLPREGVRRARPWDSRIRPSDRQCQAGTRTRSWAPLSLPLSQ
ncbi:hypothetical protein EXIGLDRAFT_425520 [Exidia glandulosa HHB12029]|uniref:Uncharacterized protein n=1 Tax=Exidia glandulosa HHB12029 TaxID=1314781 RepID=A0A165BD65_EXIGL|nr:hypothetical protein EXIGLDRAFT_425520 [Exidia glandulosa HHB12029]